MSKTGEKREACVVCGGTKGRISRGLCTSHYMKLRKHLEKLTDEGKEAFENELMREGKLLPAKQGRASKTSDPFKSTLHQLVAKNPDLINPSVPFDADKNNATAAKYAKGKKPKQE